MTVQPNQYISFSDWIASVAIDYPSQNIPIHFDEPRWRDFVDYLRENAIFPDVPQHNFFPEWRDWGMRFYELQV